MDWNKASNRTGSFCSQVVSVMSMWTRLQPAYAANMWNEALNKRLGTEVIVLSSRSFVLPLWQFQFCILEFKGYFKKVSYCLNSCKVYFLRNCLVQLKGKIHYHLPNHHYTVGKSYKESHTNSLE